MMATSFPRDPVIEFYLGDWVEITGSVKQSTAVTITGGRRDEASKLQPGSCVFVLRDEAGQWSPQNPQGDYFGLLDRNIPTRVSLRLMRDAFDRTVSNGWGTTDTGEVWGIGTGAGSATVDDWSVTPGAAKHSIDATAAYRLSTLDTSVPRNVDVKTDCVVAINNVTGGPIEPANIILRQQDGDSYYLARISVSTAEVCTISLRKHDNGVETELVSPVTVSGVVDAASSKTLSVRAQSEGQTLRAKVWKTGDPEPAGWHVLSSGNTSFPTGGVGIRSGVGGGNTNTSPVVFSYSDVTVSSMRHAGEATRLTPDRDLKGADPVVSVKSSGILQRLQQGKTPVKSAPWRYVTSLTATVPLAFWPLEGGKLTVDSNPAIGTKKAFINPAILNVLGVSPTLFMGQGELAPWLPSTAAVSQIAILQGDLPKMNIQTEWAADCLVSYTDGRYDSDLPDVFYVSDLRNPDWVMELHSFTNQITLRGPGGFGATTVSNTAVFDGGVHHLRIRWQQVGAQSYFTAYVDGAQVASNNVTFNPAYGPFIQPRAVLFAAGGTTKEKRSVGYITFYGDGAPTVATAAAAMLGYLGETAGRRAERLCGDSGVPFEYRGDLDATTPMGPQSTDTLMNVLTECVTTGLDTLYEPRGNLAVGYRTLPATVDQSEVMSLDYSAEQVSAPFLPVFDDIGILNDVTIKQKNGDEFLLEQTTGPMNVDDPGTSLGAVGRYDGGATVNVHDAEQLRHIAGWLRHLGTVPEARFPAITVNLRATEVMADAGLAEAALDVTMGDRITVDNVSSIYVFDQVSQLARGYTEVLDTAYVHHIGFNTVPEAPYRFFRLNNSASRLGSDTSTLNEVLDTTETGVDVAFTDNTPWSHASGDFEIVVDGEVMLVTGISGASSPQIFTVVRSSNGVVKAHALSAKVELFQPTYLAP